MIIKAKSNAKWTECLNLKEIDLMPQKQLGMAFVSYIWVGSKKIFTSFVGFVLFYFNIDVEHSWGENLTCPSFKKSTHYHNFVRMMIEL